MEEPTQTIKKTKGKHSLKKSEVIERHVEPENGEKREWRWWKTDPLKLVKLEQAFAIGCTDKQACGYADISETQLYYFERKNPKFTSKKAVLKDTLILKAKQAVANTVGSSYQNAMDYLKRKEREEFGDNVDHTNKGEKFDYPVGNEIKFVNFSKKDDNGDTNDSPSPDVQAKHQ